MSQLLNEVTKVKNLNSTIFDEQNIIDEETFMVSIVNDIYKTADIVNIDEWIKQYEATQTLTNQLNNNCADLEQSDIVITTDERTSMHTMDAVLGGINIANDLYNLTIRGTKCSICGKTVKYMPPNGYCSIDCAAKALAKRILEHIKGEYETQTPDIINTIKRILNYIDFCINIVSNLPDIIAGIAHLPKEYKEYATAKINIIFLYLKKVINYLMIKKNDLLINILKKMQDGTIDNNMMSMFGGIQTALTTIINIRDKMNKALGAAMDAISNANMLFYIGPQEYGFFMTLKSFMCPCPMVKSNPNLYPASQLGMPFWGPGIMTIPFDISKCQFTLDIGGMSVLQNIDKKKIDKIIRSIFKPINPVEYLMDPELFDIRLALSDQNVPAIEKLYKLLEMSVVIGGDFLPTYKNLKLTNIWFVIAILMCWGPTTRQIYGDFIFHSPL